MIYRWVTLIFSPSSLLIILSSQTRTSSPSLANHAQACDEATIGHISANGDIIELDDGTEWEVNLGDQATVLSWSSRMPITRISDFIGSPSSSGFLS